MESIEILWNQLEYVGTHWNIELRGEWTQSGSGKILRFEWFQIKSLFCFIMTCWSRGMITCLWSERSRVRIPDESIKIFLVFYPNLFLCIWLEYSWHFNIYQKLLNEIVIEKCVYICWWRLESEHMHQLFISITSNELLNNFTENTLLNLLVTGNNIECWKH